MKIRVTEDHIRTSLFYIDNPEERPEWSEHRYTSICPVAVALHEALPLDGCRPGVGSHLTDVDFVRPSWRISGEADWREFRFHLNPIFDEANENWPYRFDQFERTRNREHSWARMPRPAPFEFEIPDDQVEALREFCEARDPEPNA